MQLFDSLCSFQGALRGSRSLSSLRGAVPGSGFQSSSKSHRSKVDIELGYYFFNYSNSISYVY